MNQRKVLRNNPKTRAIIDECMEIVPPDSLEAFVGLGMKYFFDDGHVKMSKTSAVITFDYAYGLTKQNFKLRDGSVYDALVSLVFSGQFDDLAIDKIDKDLDICSIVLTETPINMGITNHINYMNVIHAYHKKDWRLLID